MAPTNNIAGICNKGKNVFGMMPHPERATSKALHNEAGKLILQSFINNTNLHHEKNHSGNAVSA